MAVDDTSEPLSSSSQTKPQPSTKMPPGMIMGPDGKPCKICTSFRNWTPRTTNNTEANANREARTSRKSKNANASASSEGEKQKANAGGVSFASLAAATAASGAALNTTDASETRADGPPPGCPPDSEQLGRATWTFLHTTAAYYPEKPTPTQRANMLMLLRSLPVLYPCTWCADDFGESLKRSAPDVSGRNALSKWLCERHNEVNEKLGKERFDCAIVDERWKDGPADGRCD